mmetsp:Transcript_36233/g.102035  ORF Transcript_36233/g.102035 Transcript_36233/m.102035 type:complete len:197 (+) Transcript_36233:3-593(+)
MDMRVASKQQEVNSIKGDYDGVMAQSNMVSQRMDSTEKQVRNSFLPKYVGINKQIQDLTSAIDARQKEKTYKTAHLNQMEQQRAKLQNKYADMAAQQEKLLKQQATLDQFKSENAQMEKELVHAREEEAKRATQIVQLKQEIADLEAKKHHILNTGETKASSAKHLEMQNRDLVGRLTKVNNAKGQIQNKIRQVVG